MSHTQSLSEALVGCQKVLRVVLHGVVSVYVYIAYGMCIFAHPTLTSVARDFSKLTSVLQVCRCRVSESLKSCTAWCCKCIFAHPTLASVACDSSKLTSVLQVCRCRVSESLKSCTAWCCKCIFAHPTLTSVARDFSKLTSAFQVCVGCQKVLLCCHLYVSFHL